MKTLVVVKDGKLFPICWGRTEACIRVIRRRAKKANEEFRILNSLLTKKECLGDSLI